MINNEMALYASRILCVKFDNFSFEDFVVGCNIEEEHGLISPCTNVTNNDLILSAKIALAHLNEHYLYYNNSVGLPQMERNLAKLEEKTFKS